MTSHQDLENESSLLYWYPKIADELPTPLTQILVVDCEERSQLIGMLDGNKISRNLGYKIKTAANVIGYPLFLRTDQASAKHDFKDAALVKCEEDLMSHIYKTIEHNVNAGIMGLNWNALVFRKFMDVHAPFNAFNFMPVGKERRYYVRDGKVICHHAYWVEGAIEEWERHTAFLHRIAQKSGGDAPAICKLPAGWKQILNDVNTETPDEISELSGYAAKFGQRVPGYWSVDFAQFRVGDEDIWYLIDAARGELSWHPADCPHCPQEQRPQVNDDEIELMLVPKDEEA